MEKLHTEKDVNNLTYSDLRIQVRTGRFLRDYSSQDKKAGKYRSGMLTKIGDIEESEWYRLAEALIRDSGDTALFKKLEAWYKNTCAWLRSEKEVHQYTLECFIAQIHNNPEWVDYEAFNKLHRPELLIADLEAEG